MCRSDIYFYQSIRENPNIEKNIKYFTQRATMCCIIIIHYNFSKLQIDIFTNNEYIIIINIFQREKEKECS